MFGKALSSCRQSWRLAITFGSGSRLLAPALDACAVEAAWEAALAVMAGSREVDTYCQNALMNVAWHAPLAGS